jgi:hypothetical protein
MGQVISALGGLPWFSMNRNFSKIMYDNGFLDVKIITRKELDAKK